MHYPQINLNGTNGKDLRKEYLNAMLALEDAVNAMFQITVHGRDYHMKGQHVTSEAQHEHSARIRQIELVKQEITEILLNIEDQLEGRRP